LEYNEASWDTLYSTLGYSLNHGFYQTLLLAANFWIDLFQKIFANFLHKHPNEHKPQTEAPMEILGGLPSCLDMVDIAPLKPN
jgi:hypothetical protein